MLPFLVFMMVQKASKSCIVSPAFFYFLLCQWWTSEYCPLTLISGIFLDCLFPISVISVGFREENTLNYLKLSAVPSWLQYQYAGNQGIFHFYFEVSSFGIEKTFILYMQFYYIIYLFKEKKKLSSSLNSVQLRNIWTILHNVFKSFSLSLFEISIVENIPQYATTQ